ncbi:MAG: FAD-dependent oxidoreductase, partial [Frankia sp.]|nr:FAD-dependent oxidoreductase [Frankia sp.]
VLDYLRRFGFRSDLVLAMYAVTDGLTGLDGDADSPGSGLNFLVHNMCRLPGAEGTWMVVRGGMGTVTAAIGDAAQAAGAHIRTGHAVRRIATRDGAVTGVDLDGETIDCDVVVCATDPFRLRRLVDDGVLPAALATRIEGWQQVGTTLKVNLALSGLPTFTSLAAPVGQHGATIHLLDEDDPLGTVAAAYADAHAGRLPRMPPIEWYIHSAVDPTLRDDAGNHSGALFVQCVPNEVAGSSWETALDAFVQRLLEICDRFAPDTSSLVVDVDALPPPGIEARFGITRGHIHHVDNAVGFADRMPYATGVAGLYAGGAGCHPAGSVIGAAGHNAARRVLADLGR